MTRFARAKGSKASNERVPEESTPWSEMKKQLVEKKQESEEVQKKQKADKIREKNYKEFLEEVEKDKSKNTEWAEFPTTKSKVEKKAKKRIAKEIESSQKTDEETEVVKKKKPKQNNEIGNKPKFEKKKPNQTALPGQNKHTLKNNKDKNKPPTEEELQKIEKKKQKKIRQLEKRKINKPNFPTKKPKVFKGDKPERRKKPQESMIINGREVPIAYVDGFPIKKEDAERIQQLRKQMISKGLPRSEIKIALKLERRKAEKAFARERKKVCFNCRKSGHNLSECPELGNQIADTAGTGICFKCGSTEHTHFECKVVRGQEFKFAQCFICQEQGHIARQCPDNARGLYPKGGACKVCGDVTHLKKDCPKYQAQQQHLQDNLKLDTMDTGENPDILDKEDISFTSKGVKRTNKIIKFYCCFIL